MTLTVDSAQIEAIERATVAAVSPAVVEQRDGWLLPFDAGSIGRARSAAPLRHDGVDTAMVAAIEQRFVAHGLQAMFRLPDVAAFAPLHALLAERGYRPSKPTLVQVSDTTSVLGVTQETPAVVSAVADAAWKAVYLGDGFDPVDGAHRVRALGRAPGAGYASIREAGQVCAVGVGVQAFGWTGIHGMRTALAYRGRGLAARVLAGLAAQSQSSAMFLQVEEGNSAALSLYRRAGFRTVWRYVYWVAELAGD